MSDSGRSASKSRGRPEGSVKLRAQPYIKKLAVVRGFDHLLAGKGLKGAPGSVKAPSRAGVQSPGEFLFFLLVEGEAEKHGLVLSRDEIKRAIRSRRRIQQKLRSRLN